MLPKSDSYYYYAQNVSTDGPGAFLLTLLVIALLVAAIIWLVFWPPKKKDEKPLKGEIDKIFDALDKQAMQFKRDEVLPTIAVARDKVTDLLRERELI